MDDVRLRASHPAAFAFQGHNVRVIMREGTPWFVAADVCKAVGIHTRDEDGHIEVNMSNVKRLMSYDEFTPYRIGGRGLGIVNVISESGLYKLLMRSDKPEARPFQDWITREVLPAIRKDGMYVMDEEKVRTGEMTEEELVLKAMTLLQRKTERLALERDHYQGIIQDNLVKLTLDAWKALNGYYLNRSETQRLASWLSKKLKKRGLKAGYESRDLELSNGKVISTEVKVYPKALIDETALELGIQVNMKFDLVPLGYAPATRAVQSLQ
jgi:prophage antirepressor-like protein